MDGAVIGVNTAILSPNGGSIGIGFAMSSNVAIRVIDQLREFGETRRGWLGVRIQNVTEDVAEALELDQAAGALVTDVPEGPALEGGMESGDVILSFDGQDVADTRALVRMVGAAKVGKTVRVIVFRNGGTETLTITLGRRETAEGRTTVDDGEDRAPESAELLGMMLSVVTKDLIAELSLPVNSSGLVVRAVNPGSPAEEKGLVAGDVITEAGQQKLTEIADLEARIDEAREAGRKSLLLLVRRGGEPRFVALPLAE